MILAGDIGGTKARIGLFDRRGGKVELVVSDQYASKEFATLEAILEEFLSTHANSVTGPLEAACFGLPGPVINGRVRVTNLPWEVVQVDVAQRLGIGKVKLVNDLVSTAAAIPTLGQSSLTTVYEGRGRVNRAGSCVVVAPGTGIGHALIHREGGWSVLLPSEGGHANFAPTTAIEIDLLRYLQPKLGHVSVESVLCGPGLVNIYSFLRNTQGSTHSNEEPISASIIATTAIEGTSPLATQALSLFCEILGKHCSNIVLTFLATGGVYLGGGIPPKIAPFLLNGGFLEGYLKKGKQRESVEATPVFIVNDDHAALHGAAAIASTL
jgi:glucokinase